MTRINAAARPDPTEEQEQIWVFQWAAMNLGVYPELEFLYHVPNGGMRSKAEAGRFKAAGVKAGVPDLCLPVARQGFHGLYIEMKRAHGGRRSIQQMRWMDALAANGYRVELCRGWEETVDVLKDYLGRRRR